MPVNCTYGVCTIKDASLNGRYLVHDGQQLTECQTEPPEGVAVFELQGQAVLQLRHQGALSISAASLVPAAQHQILVLLLKLTPRSSSTFRL